MHIIITASNGWYFALYSGVSCISPSVREVWGFGSTPEEAIVSLYKNFAQELREVFAYVGRQAYIWYPGELPGDE